MEDTYLRELLLVGANTYNIDTRSVTSKATSAYTIDPTHHGQQRMNQRNISKKELQEVRKYGQKEISQNGRYIYRYNGLVYVTNTTSTKVITCYRDTSIPIVKKTPGTKSHVPFNPNRHSQNYRQKNSHMP